MNKLKRFFKRSKRKYKKYIKMYENPVSEEVWDFHYNFIQFLLPRLELFKKDSDEMIDWHFHKEQDGVDVLAIIDSIIEDFKYIEENTYCFDNKTAKECMKRKDRAFKNLSKIYFFLWW